MFYLYRTLENDDEGDPYDFGMVQASSPARLRQFLAERLNELGLLEQGPWDVRVYEALPPGVGGGFFDTSKGFEDWAITSDDLRA